MLSVPSIKLRDLQTYLTCDDHSVFGVTETKREKENIITVLTKEITILDTKKVKMKVDHSTY